MQDTRKEVDKMKNTMKKPVAIPVEKLRPFDGHPFKVKDDDEMNTLIESIQAQGILLPLYRFYNIDLINERHRSR